MYPGLTYWDFHPWFVVTLPNSDGEVLVVNATEWAADFPDQACIIEAGEHEMITKRSVIFYQKARLYTVQTVVGSLKNKYWTPGDAEAPDALIERIREGAKRSLHIEEVKRQEVFNCGWRPGLQRKSIPLT